MISKRDRSIVQVAAFKAIYKKLDELPPLDRFVTAISQTSDDLFDQAVEERPEMIKEYLTRIRRNKKDDECGYNCC